MSRVRRAPADREDLDLEVGSLAGGELDAVTAGQGQELREVGPVQPGPPALLVLVRVQHGFGVVEHGEGGPLQGLGVGCVQGEHDRQPGLVLGAEDVDGADADVIRYDRLVLAFDGGEGDQLTAQSCHKFAAAPGRGDRGRARLGRQPGDQSTGPAGPAVGIRITQVGDQGVDGVGEDSIGEVGTLAAVLLVRGLGLFLSRAPVRRPYRLRTSGALLEEIDVRPGDLEDGLSFGAQEGALRRVGGDLVVLAAGVEAEAFEVDLDALGRAVDAREGEVGDGASELLLRGQPPVHDPGTVGEAQMPARMAVFVEGGVVGDLHPVTQGRQEARLQVGFDLGIQSDQSGVVDLAPLPAVRTVLFEQQGLQHRQRGLARDDVLERLRGVAVQAAVASPALLLGARALLEHLVRLGQGVAEGDRIGEPVQVAGATGQRVEEH